MLPRTLHRPLWSAVLTVLLAVIGVVGSVYSAELRHAWPLAAWTLSPDKFSPVALAFWVGLTGCDPVGERSGSYVPLHRPAGVPVRLVLQRCDDDRPGEPARCHLDLAVADRPAAVSEHVRIGATHVVDHEHWTVLRDPSGHEYCVIDRHD